MPKTQKTPSAEAQKLLNTFEKNHSGQSRRVGKMESVVNLVDIESIIDLNNRLRTFYEKHENPEILHLLDRMTSIMNQITEIIRQVRSKRMTLSVAEQEIQERISEIDEVVDMLKQWETAGV